MFSCTEMSSRGSACYRSSYGAKLVACIFKSRDRAPFVCLVRVDDLLTTQSPAAGQKMEREISFHRLDPRKLIYMLQIQAFHAALCPAPAGSPVTALRLLASQRFSLLCSRQQAVSYRPVVDSRHLHQCR